VEAAAEECAFESGFKLATSWNGASWAALPVSCQAMDSWFCKSSIFFQSRLLVFKLYAYFYFQSNSQLLM
jgi:hypothetical protein